MIKKIFITGASSGLGWALAKSYDSENNILGLVGRNKENLLKLQKQLSCRSYRDGETAQPPPGQEGGGTHTEHDQCHHPQVRLRGQYLEYSISE